MDKKQTAVEWLEDVYNTQGRIFSAQFEQAKEMERSLSDVTAKDFAFVYEKAASFAVERTRLFAIASEMYEAMRTGRPYDLGKAKSILDSIEIKKTLKNE